MADEYHEVKEVVVGVARAWDELLPRVQVAGARAKALTELVDGRPRRGAAISWPAGWPSSTTCSIGWRPIHCRSGAALARAIEHERHACSSASSRRSAELRRALAAAPGPTRHAAAGRARAPRRRHDGAARGDRDASSSATRPACPSRSTSWRLALTEIEHAARQGRWDSRGERAPALGARRRAATRAHDAGRGRRPGPARATAASCAAFSTPTSPRLGRSDARGGSVGPLLARRRSTSSTKRRPTWTGPPSSSAAPAGAVRGWSRRAIRADRGHEVRSSGCAGTIGRRLLRRLRHGASAAREPRQPPTARRDAGAGSWAAGSGTESSSRDPPAQPASLASSSAVAGRHRRPRRERSGPPIASLVTDGHSSPSTSSSGPGRRRPRAAEPPRRRPGRDPSVPRDPESAVMADPSVAEARRFCAECKAPVGRSRRATPGRTEGFCRQLRTSVLVPAASLSRAIWSPGSTRSPAAWPTAGWAGSTWPGIARWPTAGWCSRASSTATTRTPWPRPCPSAASWPRSSTPTSSRSTTSSSTAATATRSWSSSTGTSLRRAARRAADGQRRPARSASRSTQAIAYVLDILPALGHLHDARAAVLRLQARQRDPDAGTR